MKNHPFLSFLIGICIFSNILSCLFFFLEVTMHPSSFNWVPALFTLGMFVVPGLTAKGRMNKNEKNFYDVLFVLYGIVTHSICSLSVGLAGDSPWGCSLDRPFDCDMNHPGIWGAFFFAISSITGHAFGWEKIAIQRMAINWIGVSNFDPTNEFHNNQKEKFIKQVWWSYCWSMYTIIVCFILSIAQISFGHSYLGYLYLFTCFFTGILKGVNLLINVGINGAAEFSQNKKGLWFSILNITLIVWIVGANWYILGTKIHEEKDLGFSIISTLLTFSIAFVQHYHI